MEMGDESLNKREIGPMSSELYQWAMYDRWKPLKKYYMNNPKEVVTPLTANEDTVLHAVAFSGCDHQVLKDLIDLLPPTSERLEALKMENGYGCTPLHDVAWSGNVKAANVVLESSKIGAAAGPDHDHHRRTQLDLMEMRNHLGETPLYRAAALGHTKLVKFFAGRVDQADIDQKHFFRNDMDQMSILHSAVISQHFDTALWLQKKYPGLAEKREKNGFTTLQLLAQMPSAFENKFHKSIWKKFIYHCLPTYDHYVGPDNDNLVPPPNPQGDLECGLGCNQPCKSSCLMKLTGMAKKKITVRTMKLYIGLWNWLAKGWPNIHIIWKEKKNQVALSDLTYLLVKRDYSWMNSSKEHDWGISLGSLRSDRLIQCKRGEKGNVAEKKPTNYGSTGNMEIKYRSEVEEEEPTSQDKQVQYSFNTTSEDKKGQYLFNMNSTPLLIATSTGILTIVEKILEVYPMAVEHVSDDEERNILHMAFKHRRLEIYKLVKSSKTVTQRLSPRIDCDDNTIMHQAADMEYYSAETQPVGGPAMQLQEELHWMERAEKIAPRHYNMHRNRLRNNKTAEALFKDQHAYLLKLAQEWTKTTAQSCSAVAALIATVVFAAAFTAPGGNDNNGNPILLHSSIFLIFIISDAVSLVSSLTSLLMFLSILMSPFEYQDFRHSIPRKLMIGFILLFSSVITTMITFTTSTVLLIRHKRKWTKFLMFILPSFPVSVFGLVHFPLFKASSQGFKFICKKIGKALPGNFFGCSKRNKILGKTKPY